jgi:polar amino acid transport system substrate-binding protein
MPVVLPAVITVAYLDEPPFFAPTADPTAPGGCDIELLRHVLDDLGVREVEFVLTTFRELIPGVIEGRWMMNVPMFVSAGRASLVDFSRPVWVAADGFIVRSADATRWRSYEAIAADADARLAVVVAQIQEQTALAAGVPPERIERFADQDAAAAAVRTGGADASASTALGSRAFLERALDPALVFVADAPAVPRPGLPVGAFSFAKSSSLAAPFDDALGRYLGTEHHLAMMARYGFTRDDLAPVL